MKIIKCLADKIDEELNDAQSYAELAERWKEEEPETADLFLELSQEEMGHMEKLHEEAVRIIDEYREKHGEPPEGIKMLYDYLHGKHIEKAKMVKVMQGMYKA